MKKKIRNIIISVILIIVFALSLFIYVLDIDDAIYNEEDKLQNTPYAVSTYTSTIKITNEGLVSDITAEELWNEMIKEGNNIQNYLDSYEELEKLMNAEIITQYPKIGKGNLDGIIIFKRYKEDETQPINLKYMELELFQNYVNSNSITTTDNKDIRDYFTIDSSGNVVVPIINKEKYKDSEGNIVITNTITTKTVNYKNGIKKYTMPFQYLWSLLVACENKDFVLEIADLVYDGEIEISIYDNIVTTVVETEYKYKKQTLTEKYARLKIDKDYGVNGYSKERYWLSEDLPSDIEEKTYYNPNYQAKIDISEEMTETKEEIFYENTLFFDLTKANVWIIDYSKEFERKDNTNIEQRDVVLDNTEYNLIEFITSNDNNNLLEDDDALKFANETKKIIEGYSKKVADVKVDYVWCKNFEREIDRKQKIVTTTTSSTWIEKNCTSIPKIDSLTEPNFVTILSSKKYKYVREQLTYEIISWLIEMLENNPDTVDMVDLTKYLLYKVTGESYDGVDEFDFSTYKDTNFKEVVSGGNNQLIRYIHTFEHVTPPPTTSDGSCYIIEDDGYGHATVGYGVDIENSGYKSLFVDSGYPTSIGEKVPKEFVDSIEQLILEKKISEITAIVTGLNLKEYQINALVSRAYNCGTFGALKEERNGKDFVGSYKKYWDSEKDDQFEIKNSNANYNHLLYSKYMYLPNTSKGDYSPGLEKRRKSEWTLFQTGYYDILNEWHSGINGTIVEIAKNIHEYMEKNNYSYCVYGGNKYEECGKLGFSFTHGLNQTFEQSKTGYHHTCCATFVSWVLQESGYLKDSEHMNGANALQSKLINKGWIRITEEKELEPGDVLCYDGHVEIYAGDNKIYNAGSGNAIRNSSPQNNSKKFDYALRAPN